MVNQRSYPGLSYWYVSEDPLVNPIRNEDRFKKIEGEMKEKNKKERERVLRWLETEPLKTDQSTHILMPSGTK